ncbi:MAG: hypothetical protein WC873_04495 [Candidatus Gracilibacteria bacterium]
MFLTIMINTKKVERAAIKMRKNRFDPTKGWRAKGLRVRGQKGFFERVKLWRKLKRPMTYTVEKQAAMF